LRDPKVHLRFSSRVLWFLGLAALAAGVAIAPMRTAAQEAGEVNKPETAAPPAADAPSNAKHESTQSESEEEQQKREFRLEGPVVKWTSKTLNLSIEKTADLYEILNFLIIALGIGIPLYRFLPKYLRQRKQKLRDDLESARKLTEDANARLSAVEVKLSKLDEEIQKFRAEVEAESLQDEARIKASLAEESSRIVEAAEQTDRALIAEFVADVVGNGAAKGGRN
jgi:F-type H+-transporting ATPase subunit b